MTRQSIYLDHNATTPLRAEAATAMTDAMSVAGNPSSVHGHGRLAREQVDRARGRVATAVGARPEDVVFTSGGTEANALALFGIEADRVLASSIEHESVLAAVPSADRLPVTPDGIVDLDALDRHLAAFAGRMLVSIMWANNETGAIQPVEEIARIVRRHGALFHCDAVQALGRLPLDMEAGGPDLVTISAHKIGGPAGVGAVVLRPGIVLRPRSVGGGQERGRRAGTENRLGIVGFGAAAEAAGADLEHADAIGGLRDAFEARLAEVAPEAVVLAVNAPRLPNTSCVAMPGVAAETQVMALDLAGLSVSAGAACSSGKVKRSHVIEAMLPGSEAAATAIRISFGPFNAAEDVERLAEAWLSLYRRASRRVA